MKFLHESQEDPSILYNTDIDFFWETAWKCGLCDSCHEGSDILNYIHKLAEMQTGEQVIDKCFEVWGIAQPSLGVCQSVCDQTPMSCNQFPDFCSCKAPDSTDSGKFCCAPMEGKNETCHSLTGINSLCYGAQPKTSMTSRKSVDFISQ